MQSRHSVRATAALRDVESWPTATAPLLVATDHDAGASVRVTPQPATH